MMGKKAAAARLLKRLGVLSLAAAVRARQASAVTILAYHRVLDLPSEETFPYDVELVSASVEDFARQMKYVKERFTPISFADLLRFLDRGENPPRGSVIVTFDDGFADNYHNAFPVLKALQVPATIFLATGYLDQQEQYWYEKLTYAVMTTRMAQAAIQGLGSIPLGETVLARRQAVKRLLRELKRMPNRARVETVGTLLKQLLPDGDAGPDPRSGPMTWEQVREMAQHNIEFGSHSVTHPVLSQLEPAQLAFELEHSKNRIEAMSDAPVKVIAYPVGGEEAFNDAVRKAVRTAGYRLGVSYIPGVNRYRDWDPYALRRLHVERYVDDAYFRAMMVLPGLFT
jgi:peptidoglycan/xylan/chitin deacetylase (PgdA/CDA1 family)